MSLRVNVATTKELIFYKEAAKENCDLSLDGQSIDQVNEFVIS